MNELRALDLRYSIFHEGEPISMQLTINPERITLQPFEDGLRLDIKQYDGNDLAWFIRLRKDFFLEIR